MDEVTNYQCPACTGPLHFVGSTGRLQCDYCGSSFDVAEIEQIYRDKQEAAEDAYEEKSREETEQAADTQDTEEEQMAEDAGFDESEMSDSWGEDGEKMRAYNCPSCGAELICDETTAATSCPYCGNPTVVPGVFSDTLRPDFVIPFKLDQKQAEDALRAHYRGKRLLPKGFAAESRIRELKGVYVPFWLFDGDAEVAVNFAATRSSTHREGDYRVTRTQHYKIHRAGSVDFEKVPVDASSKMPDEYMDAVEPFDYSQLEKFSVAYLPGFLADKYDVSAADCSQRAKDRAARTAVRKMEADVGLYDTCTITDQQVSVRKGRVHYALLPVYMLTTKWKDQDYLFAMNGQTGRLIGNLPISWGRFWAWFAGITVPLTLLLGSVLQFLL